MRSVAAFPVVPIGILRLDTPGGFNVDDVATLLERWGWPPAAQERALGQSWASLDARIAAARGLVRLGNLAVAPVLAKSSDGSFKLNLPTRLWGALVVQVERDVAPCRVIEPTSVSTGHQSKSIGGSKLFVRTSPLERGLGEGMAVGGCSRPCGWRWDSQRQLGRSRGSMIALGGVLG